MKAYIAGWKMFKDIFFVRLNVAVEFAVTLNDFLIKKKLWSFTLKCFMRGKDKQSASVHQSIAVLQFKASLVCR